MQAPYSCKGHVPNIELDISLMHARHLEINITTCPKVKNSHTFDIYVVNKGEPTNISDFVYLRTHFG